ncbi:MAG TPA: TIGR00341 family protein [Thermodesulfobacteriota bacterium]|nr:TIGR00341 family protein [Thermodesulfobacteriota bacterium]
MLNEKTGRAKAYVKEWLEKKAAQVNQRAVIKDVYLEVDITAGYFFLLTIANLIALSGLITNNTSVIIGAMLISPLMGPILSSGFAFITGDALIGRKALKKITLSVALTIVVAAFATALSPLQDLTGEILARVRPNLYDLGVAFLAGTAGALAICTKRNYLTIVPGVAIATAVIPPLSVTGFGVGTLNLRVALGGFFLFFTNFVTIIICTCLVFYVYGFRPGMVTEMDKAGTKRRLLVLLGILFLISLPLLYTLHRTIAEARLRKNIEYSLKKDFDRERSSHLSTFAYREGKDRLDVSATVNTVAYFKDNEVNAIEKNISEYLARPVTLEIEQVLVQGRGLKEEPPATVIAPVIAPEKTASEPVKTAREDTGKEMAKAVRKIDSVISPSKVSGFFIGFSDRDPSVSIELTVLSDTAFTDSETLWLKRMLVEELATPVELKIKTAPFVRPLVFEGKEAVLTEGMKRSFEQLKVAFSKDPALEIEVRSSRGPVINRLTRRLVRDRAEAVRKYIVEELKVPAGQVKTTVSTRKTREPSTVTVAAKKAKKKPR